MVAAALRLIALEGDAAMTLRRVAAEAQIPMSSLYELFPSQNAVRGAVMREVAERIAQRIDALPEDLSGRQWALAALRALLPLNPQRRHDVVATLYIGASGLHDPGLRAEWKLVDDAVRETCLRALDAMGLKGGESQLHHLHAVIDGLTRQMVLQTGEQQADWAVTVLDRMLPATPALAPAVSPHPPELNGAVGHA